MQSLQSVFSWMKSTLNNRINDSPTSEMYLEFPTKDLETFILLLNEDPVIEDFLLFDSCNVLADKYLLAITFVYFIRARLERNQYNRKNFFSALYLAHLMEEDDDTMLEKLISWYEGRNQFEKKRGIIRNQVQLWHKMNYRTLVSKRTCEEVIEIYPDSNIWRRFRPECHSGAVEMPTICHQCKVNDIKDSWLEGLLYEDELYEERPAKAIKKSHSVNAAFSNEPPAKVAKTKNLSGSYQWPPSQCDASDSSSVTCFNGLPKEVIEE